MESTNQRINNKNYLYPNFRPMNKALSIYTLALGAFLTVAILGSYAKMGKNPEPTPAVFEEGNNPQFVRPVDLDRDFDFAGEKVPMNNPDALERLDRELLVNTYWQSSTMLNMKNAGKFFPVIEPILAKNGIPDDFKYVSVAESNLRNEVSSAGAKGFWQFMTETAKYYGLEISDEVDERYHVEKATEAACKYIKDYKKRFGAWTLCAAAYNMGGTRLAKELEKQRGTDYYSLSLNSETSRYVFRVIAIKEIMQRPRDFGFYLEEDDLYSPRSYEEVTVDTAVSNWGDFAAQHGISYRALKYFNPWLISDKLTNAGKKEYVVRIPKEKF